jgi:ribosomal protein S27AE
MSHPEAQSNWDTLIQQVKSHLDAWGEAHPTPTMLDIEQATSQALAPLYAQAVQDLALHSANADLSHTATAQRPTCSDCGVLLHARGKSKRKLHSQQDQSVQLERDYAVCPQCGKGFFPPRLATGLERE